FCQQTGAGVNGVPGAAALSRVVLGRAVVFECAITRLQTSAVHFVLGNQFSGKYVAVSAQ
ncbi:hypothetical protein ACJMK2_032991, partial [Sinanodonta woodiana]